MSNNVAPSCPVSYGQPIPGQRVFHKGEPWRRPGSLQDLINSIPTATDLKSALVALNIINSAIQRLNRGEPMVNNTRIDGQPDIKEKGEDLNPNYSKADWIQESRDYTPQKLRNPDNPVQYIEVKVLKMVTFHNPNTSYGLTYYSTPGA